MKPMHPAMRLVEAAVIATTLAACTTMSVTSDYDSTVNFSALKTYDWIPERQKPTGDPRIDGNTLLESRIRTAVERVLAEKGFVKETTTTPDVLVGYHVTLDKTVSVTTLNSYYGYAPGWGWRYGYSYAPYGYIGGPETYVYEYDEGTLILDIMEPETRRLIWRGAASDEVNLAASPEKKQEQIDEAVELIFQTFPPKRQ